MDLTSVSEQIRAIDRLIENLDQAANSPAGNEALAGRTLPEIWTMLVKAEAAMKEMERLRETAAQSEAFQAENETLQQRLVELQWGALAREAILVEVQELLREGDPERIPGKIQDLRGQVANLRGRAGLDHPPCWAEEDGDIEYLYTVDIRDDGLVVEQAWPDRRNDQLEGVGAPRITSPVFMTLNEFRATMRRPYDYGRQSRPECRFFVRVGDQSSVKDAYKQGLATIESYYYKLLLN